MERHLERFQTRSSILWCHSPLPWRLYGIIRWFLNKFSNFCQVFVHFSRPLSLQQKRQAVHEPGRLAIWREEECICLQQKMEQGEFFSHKKRWRISFRFHIHFLTPPSSSGWMYWALFPVAIQSGKLSRKNELILFCIWILFSSPPHFTVPKCSLLHFSRTLEWAYEQTLSKLETVTRSGVNQHKKRPPSLNVWSA